MPPALPRLAFGDATAVESEDSDSFTATQRAAATARDRLERAAAGDTVATVATACSFTRLATFSAACPPVRRVAVGHAGPRPEPRTPPSA